MPSDEEDPRSISMRLSSPALALLAVLAFAPSAVAQLATASHEVTVRVGTVDAVAVGQGMLEIAIEDTDGSADVLTMRSASASSTYSVQTNGEGRKLMVHLDDDLPQGLRLEATVGLGSDERTFALGAQPRTFFEGITRVSYAGQPLRYTLHAEVGAGDFAGSRLVTYTLTQR